MWINSHFLLQIPSKCGYPLVVDGNVQRGKCLVSV